MNKPFVLDRTNQILWILWWGWLLFTLGTVPFAAEKNGDFVHFWVAGRVIARGDGSELYNPIIHREIIEETGLDMERVWGPRYEILGVFFYPPPAGLFYAGFGALSLYQAQATQAVLNILFLLCASWLLYQLLDGQVRLPLIGLLLFTFPGNFYTYVLGQNGIFTLTLTLASWYFFKQQKFQQGGIMLALLSYKPNWFLGLVWAPFVQRWWKAVGGLIIGVSGFVLLSWLVLGTKPFLDYAHQFFLIANLHQLPKYPLDSQYSVLSLFRRVWGNGLQADVAGLSMMGLVGLLTVWLSWPRPGENQTNLWKLTAGLTWATAVWLNPHLHHYDLILTCPALIVALSEWQTLSKKAKAALVSLFIFHHIAFIIIDITDLTRQLPLPILATFLVWSWLGWHIYEIRRPTLLHR